MQKQTETNVQTFKCPTLGELRAYKDEDGKEWFCLRDVAKVLAIENRTNLRERLNPRGVGKTYLLRTNTEQWLYTKQRL